MRKLGRLEKVDIKTVWKTEYNDFTPWLAQEENINLLGDELKTDLEVIDSDLKVNFRIPNHRIILAT